MNLVLIFIALFFILGLIIGPLAIAVASKLRNGTRLSDWAVSIGLKSIWQPAVTFDAASELTLKRRSLDEEHDGQKIGFSTGLFGSTDRHLFDPKNRIHNFFATPFAFVDERFGIVVDPRDAIIGKQLADEQERHTYTRVEERGESLVESVLGVFEVPGDYVGSRLPDVWTLVGGSFDAQFVDLIHEYYQKGQAPKSSTTALRQLLVPVGTFVAVVLLGMFASSQGGGGGGAAPAAGNSSEITFGLLASLFASTDRDTRNTAVTAGFAIVGLLVFGGLFLAMPMTVTLLGIPLPIAAWSAIVFGLGVVVLPIVSSFFGRSLGAIGMGLGKLWIVVGLLGYRRPVVTLVGDSKYNLLEYDAVDWDEEPAFYRFAMTRVGVGIANDVDVWADDVTESPARVDEMGSMQSDGGVSPPGYASTDLIQVGPIRGYVPKDVNPDATYVRTDRSTGWYLEAGQQTRLMRAALETAKKKFGGGNKPVGDKWVLGATLVAMTLGAIFDWVVYF